MGAGSRDARRRQRSGRRVRRADPRPVPDRLARRGRRADTDARARDRDQSSDHERAVAGDAAEPGAGSAAHARRGSISEGALTRKESVMPKKEIVQVSPAAPNQNLSPATKFGNLVFVSGQTGRHPVTGEVGKDIREQTRNVLERIKQILTAAGTSMDNVLTATTYVTRRDDVPAYNEEYAKYFPTNKPARTTVTVASLNSADLLIEITVAACIPS